MARNNKVFIPGPAGRIEVFIEKHEVVKAIALITHPHPLFGGTAENKVVTTIARTLSSLGCAILRPQFRGVGASDGAHDNGIGEAEDIFQVLAYGRQQFGLKLPVILSGFSFGAYVITLLSHKLAQLAESATERAEKRPKPNPSSVLMPSIATAPPIWMILIGTAVGAIEGNRHYEPPTALANTLIIHGANDTTVPLENVLHWAEPLNLVVQVIPGADHFFHHRLFMIQKIIESAWPLAAQQLGLHTISENEVRL